MGQNLTEEEKQIYMQQLMDNYQNPSNYLEMKNSTISHHEKNASCGDSFTLYLKVENNIIKEISYYGQGCAISTASFSLLSQKLKGLKIEDAKKFSKEELLEIIGIQISPARMNCAMLSLNALRNTLCNLK